MDCPTCKGHGNLDWTNFMSEESSNKTEMENGDKPYVVTPVQLCHRCGGSGFLEQYYLKLIHDMYIERGIKNEKRKAAIYGTIENKLEL
jgi:DnaJ-class molecular chaperone